MCADVRSGIYVEALNVSHQVSLVVEILLAYTTAPNLGPRGISLEEALLIDV